MLSPNEIELFSMIFDKQMKELEAQVMLDIIRRISINGEITRSADWQLYRLYELGKSKRVLKKAIKGSFNLDSKSINHFSEKAMPVMKAFTDTRAKPLYRLTKTKLYSST